MTTATATATMATTTGSRRVGEGERPNDDVAVVGPGNVVTAQGRARCTIHVFRPASASALN